MTEPVQDSGDLSGSSAEAVNQPLKTEPADQQMESFDAELYIALFDQSGMGKAILSDQGQIMTCNQSLRELLGYPADVISQQTWADWFIPAERPFLEQICRQLIKGQLDSYHAEKSLLHQAGHMIWTKLHLVRLIDPASQEHRLLLEVQDVTHQYQQELAFRAEQERLLQAEQLARLVYGVLDIETGITIWSAEMWRLLGLDTEHYVPTVASVLSYYHPEDVPMIIQNIENVIKNSQTITMRCRFNRPDGKQLNLMILMESQHVANLGSQMLVTMLDMGASLAPELEDANRKLAAQNAELKQLSEIADDQLTSPLAGLQAIAEHVEWSGLKASSQQGLKALEELSQNLIEARKPSYEMMPVSIEYAAQKALQILEPQTAGRPIKISLDFSAWAYVEMIPFYLDNLLYQLFRQTFIQSDSDQSLKVRLSNDFDALTRHLLNYEVLGCDLSPLFQDSESVLGQLKTLLEAQGSQIMCLSTGLKSCFCRIQL